MEDRNPTNQRARQITSRFHDMLHPDILNAPRAYWDDVDVRCTHYLEKLDENLPWFHHLTFMVIILATYTKLDPQTVYRYMSMHAARWQTIFSAYELQSFSEWKPIEHLPRYMQDSSFPDTQEMRQEFLRSYVPVADHMSRYLRSLPSFDQARYQHWVFPLFPADLRRQLSNTREWQAEQQQRRKGETDALFPHFARMRGMAHFRWNQIQRLQEKIHEAVTLVESEETYLPLLFSYEEPSLERRLHFRLWDQASFSKKYMDSYQNLSALRRDLNAKTKDSSPEKRFFFLEFIHAEHLIEGTYEPELPLWFGDLLRYDLFGHSPTRGTKEEVQRKQDYLHSWGYDKKGSMKARPFETQTPGLLKLPAGKDLFLHHAQKRSKGLLFEVNTIERRDERTKTAPSVATETLSREARTHSASSQGVRRSTRQDKANGHD